VGNVSQSDSPERARQKAADKISADVSGRTLEKGKTVKEKAEDGDEDAKEAWEGLQSGEESFSSAYDKATGSDGGGNGDGEDDESDISQFTSQKTDEWSSPKELVEPLDDAVGGFDLDPCSGAEESPFANNTYTEDEDGLAQPWKGVVWVNPPYSGVSEWVDKAVNETVHGNAKSTFFLCKGDSSTNWWQRAAKHATCVLAIDHRLSFGDGENSAPFASHILVFGDSMGAVDELRNHGLVLSKHD